MPKIYQPSKYVRIVESVLSGTTCLATARLLKVSRGLVLRTMARHRAGKPVVPGSLTRKLGDASSQKEAVSPDAGLCQAWRRTKRCTCQSSGLLLWYMVKGSITSRLLMRAVNKCLVQFMCHTCICRYMRVCVYPSSRVLRRGSRQKRSSRPLPNPNSPATPTAPYQPVWQGQVSGLHKKRYVCGLFCLTSGLQTQQMGSTHWEATDQDCLTEGYKSLKLFWPEICGLLVRSLLSFAIHCSLRRVVHATATGLLLND